MSEKIIGATVGTPIRPAKLANDLADRIEEIIKTKTEQEKTVDITENGTVEILPDEGFKLTKVTANVAVGGGENKLTQMFNKTITEITAEDLDGATIIPGNAFYLCNTLIKADIPDSVVKIEGNAFYGCDHLLEITLRNGLEEIELSFEYCSALTSITMPSTLKKIHVYAFRNCNNITDVFIENLSSWCKACQLTNKPSFSQLSPPMRYSKKFYTKNAFGEYEIPTSIEIPIDVQQVGVGAFFCSWNLLSVTIPSNVKTIRYYAFCYCKNLTTVNIENGVEVIEDCAFQQCESLTSIAIPDSITSIGSDVFSGCANLTNIYINKPEGSISGSPWGATNATIHWNTPLPSEEA